MKTNFKIFLVISSFVVFYFALIPILQTCQGTDFDCTLWQELMLLTRPVVVSSQHTWNTGDDLGTWAGTTEGLEIPTSEDQIMNNITFGTSMIVLPLVIIGFIAVWDKKNEN